MFYLNDNLFFVLNNFNIRISFLKTKRLLNNSHIYIYIYINTCIYRSCVN